jgi:hypothetical protein
MGCNCLGFWAMFSHFVAGRRRDAIVVCSQEEAKRVENPYKIRVDYFSVSELGYKTPFFIRPVPKPLFLARTGHNMDLIYQ